MRSGLRRLWPAVLVAVLGVALTAPIAAGLHAAEQRSLDRVLDQQSLVARTAVAAQLRRYTDTARHVAASLGALPSVDAAAFARVTAAVRRENLPGVTGLSVSLPAAPPRVAVPAVSVDPREDLAVVAPLYRRTTVVGWVRLRLDGPGFLLATLREARQGPVAVALDVTGADGRTNRVAEVAAGTDGRTHRVAEDAAGTGRLAAVERTVGFALGAQSWSLRVRAAPDAAGLLGVDAHLDETALVIGAGTSVLLAVGVQLLAGARARARALAAAATADLHRTERSARQQAALFQAVLDGIEEGVAVADEDGSVALLNPSALATPATPDGPFSGALRADGVTPYPDAELPLRRAMSGTACTDELVIRAPAHPGGLRLRVSAQPLDVGAGRRGAIAVCRDVTALRACEAELHGLTAALADLGRGRSAPERVRRTIDGLLAYAAARDTPLRPADVDLNDLVAGVLPTVLRPDPARTPPHLVVRRLPVVRGDADLLGQLFVQLLSNAVKYTPPDETPRIAVRAHPVPDADGWSRIEIADHGIGIPPGEHARLFGGFPGVGPGSGTGLLICHRIVERHGGTIAATDNPGGGTLVGFTLPIAAEDRASAGHGSSARPLFTPQRDGVVAGMVDDGWLFNNAGCHRRRP